MKKILSMLLVLTLMFALAVPAFAASTTDGSDEMPHEKKINVYAELDLGEPEIGGTVYYTEISWDIGSFMTEEFAPKYVWMPNGVSEQDTTPQYTYGWTAEDLANTGWANTEANFSLTLTNRSNAEVDATVRYWGYNAVPMVPNNLRNFFNQSGVNSEYGEVNVLHNGESETISCDNMAELDSLDNYSFKSFYASLNSAAPENPSATNLKGAPQSAVLTGTLKLDSSYSPSSLFPSGKTQYSFGQLDIFLHVD